MIHTKKMLLFALILPIFILLTLTLYKRHLLLSGVEVMLPISGYDPRDLLSGHYIIYNVEYGTSDMCTKNVVQKAYVCLDNRSFSYEYPHQCKVFISGTCSYGRFIAGIERYYIPENAAYQLDKDVRDKKASIIISVSPNGYSQVKDLLINDIPWR